MHDPNPAHWRRVARAIKRRREELSLTRPKIYGAGGPSLATQQNLDRASGLTYRDDTISALEDTLQWERGSVQNVLAGREPTPAGPRRVIPAEANPTGRPLPLELPASAWSLSEEQMNEVAANAMAAALRSVREVQGGGT